MLEAAAINPHDGDAQYQLGLIHQQRRQVHRSHPAIPGNAVAIDPTRDRRAFPVGPHRARAGPHRRRAGGFQIVSRQDDKHSLSEIHRELGAVVPGAGRTAEARRELELYTDRRAYDPEGLYYYGQVLERLGNPAEAREMYARAVEAARTAPRYRRHEVARWSRLAQKAGSRL